MELKSIIFYLLSTGLLLTGCQQRENSDWQHLDLQKDGVFGISDNRTYAELQSGKTGTSVIVAVLDGGVDTGHEDLKSILWINDKEKPGNGVDDDSNGYIDDVHGWNFLSTSDSSFKFDNAELTRLVRQGKQRFGQQILQTVILEDRGSFVQYQTLVSKFENEVREIKDQLADLRKLKATTDLIVHQLGKKEPALKDFLDFSPKNDGENQVRSLVNLKMKRKTFAEFYQEDILDIMERMQNDLDYHYSLNYVPAATHTGNADVTGPDALHGTHVAGIIAADRNNSVGIHGIANHVQ
ncbi:Subtilase family protein, partial [bacterium A37T11]